MPLVTPDSVAKAAALASLPEDEAPGGDVHPSATRAAEPEVQVRAFAELRERMGSAAYSGLGLSLPSRIALGTTGASLVSQVEAWESETGSPPTEGDPGTPPTEKGRAYLTLSVAASLLCFVVALPTLNLRGLRLSGGFMQSTGYNESREQLLSIRDINEIQKTLREQVDAALGQILASGLLDLQAAVSLSQPRPVTYPVVRSNR